MFMKFNTSSFLLYRSISHASLYPTPVLCVNGTCHNADNAGEVYEDYATARATVVQQADIDIEVTHGEDMNNVISGLSTDLGFLFGCPIIDCMKETTMLRGDD